MYNFLNAVTNERKNQMKIKKPMFRIIAEVIDKVQAKNGHPKAKNYYEDYPFIFEIVENIYKEFFDEILNIPKREFLLVTFPISIFNKKLGMLESICLYLKDEMKLSFKVIADLLKRDYKTVYTSYQKAKEKVRKTIK